MATITRKKTLSLTHSYAEAFLWCIHVLLGFVSMLTRGYFNFQTATPFYKSFFAEAYIQ